LYSLTTSLDAKSYLPTENPQLILNVSTMSDRTERSHEAIEAFVRKMGTEDHNCWPGEPSGDWPAPTCFGRPLKNYSNQKCPICGCQWISWKLSSGPIYQGDREVYNQTDDEIHLFWFSDSSK